MQNPDKAMVICLTMLTFQNEILMALTSIFTVFRMGRRQLTITSTSIMGSLLVETSTGKTKTGCFILILSQPIYTKHKSCCKKTLKTLLEFKQLKTLRTSKLANITSKIKKKFIQKSLRKTKMTQNHQICLKFLKPRLTSLLYMLSSQKAKLNQQIYLPQC